MNICLTAIANTLNSQLDSRFGRCNYFIIQDPEKTNFKPIKNELTKVSERAGVLAAQLLADNKVKHVITGNVGSRAMQALKNVGIEVSIERNITIKDAIAKFRSGKIIKTNTPTVCGYTLSSQDTSNGIWRV